MKLSWDDILKLPKTVSISDFHCVEGWSVLNCKWEGVLFREIVNLAKPKETAKFATFECADGYTTSLTLAELAGDDVLLAYKLDGKELEEGLGFPLRLVVPSKYAYKSALWVTRVRFTCKERVGLLGKTRIQRHSRRLEKRPLFKVESCVFGSNSLELLVSFCFWGLTGRSKRLLSLTILVFSARIRED